MKLFQKEADHGSIRGPTHDVKTGMERYESAQVQDVGFMDEVEERGEKLNGPRLLGNCL